MYIYYQSFALREKTPKAALDVIEIIFNSDMISAIMSISLTIYTESGHFKFSTPKSVGYGYDYFEDSSKYELQESLEAKTNKTLGLKIDIEKLKIKRFNGQELNNNILTPGIKGFKQIKSLLLDLISNNTFKIPLYLQNKTITGFEFNSAVIWKAWVEFKEKHQDSDDITLSTYRDLAIGSQEYQLYLSEKMSDFMDEDFYTDLVNLIGSFIDLSRSMPY